MSTKCSIDDLPYLRSLVYTLKSSVFAVSKTENCKIASNWGPMIVIGSIPFLREEFEFTFLTADLAKRTLPETLQGVSPIKHVLDSLDPDNEINLDEEDAEDLKQIFHANDGELVKTVKKMSESPLFSMQNEADHLIERINLFLTCML